MDEAYLVSPTRRLEWTNKILPQDSDKTWKVVAKFALIIATLGTIFLVTLTRDLTKAAYNWLTTKKPPEPKPPTTGKKIIESVKVVGINIANTILTPIVASIETISSPFIPTIIFSQQKDSFTKYGCTGAYIATTTSIASYFGGRYATAAALVGHTIACSIKPLSEYFWSEKKKA